MTALMNIFDSLFVNLRSLPIPRGFGTPGKAKDSRTKVAIKFQNSNDTLLINIEENSIKTSSLPAGQSAGEDVLVKVNKSMEDFLTNGITENDLVIEGLTNRNSTNSKLVNAMDCAYYYLNGAMEIPYGLQ